MIIELRRDPLGEEARATHHSAEIGRTASFTLITRRATGPDLMISMVTHVSSFELRDCLGQSVHAHCEGDDGSEDGLELHDRDGDEAPWKDACFVSFDGREMVRSLIFKMERYNERCEMNYVLEENCYLFIHEFLSLMGKADTSQPRVEAASTTMLHFVQNHGFLRDQWHWTKIDSITIFARTTSHRKHKETLGRNGR